MPKKPPVIAPRKSEGANTPPEPPDPIVIEVARIFAKTSRPMVSAGRVPSSEPVIVV